MSRRIQDAAKKKNCRRFATGSGHPDGDNILCRIFEIKGPRNRYKIVVYFKNLLRGMFAQKTEHSVSIMPEILRRVNQGLAKFIKVAIMSQL